MKALSRQTNEFRALEVEQRLRASRRVEVVPADLHQSIMKALQSHDQESREDAPAGKPWGLWLKWIAATGTVTACLVFGFMLMRAHDSRQNSSPDWAMAVAAAATPADVTANLPAALSPLSDELTHVQNDLDRTRAFLLSSLP